MEGHCFCDSTCAVYNSCCSDFATECPAQAKIAGVTAEVETEAKIETKSMSATATTTTTGKGKGKGKNNNNKATTTETTTKAGKGKGKNNKKKNNAASALDLNTVAGSCVGLCGQRSGSCFCEESCVTTGDCCEDFATVCQ